MDERSPEDVASGVLRIAIGGSVKQVPTLKAKYVSQWGALFSDRGAEPVGEWTMDDVVAFSEGSVSRLVDLVVAYDMTGALGGREWLEEHADPAQLNAALILMIGNAFPLADAATLASLTLARAAVQSLRPSSTNGHSPTGTSTRTRSDRASTRSR